MERFSPEALDFEQQKQEALLEASKSTERKMNSEEVQEFLNGMDEYGTALVKILVEKRAKLSKTKNTKVKAVLEAEIEEILPQILELRDFKADSKDAEEFTVRPVG